MHLLRHKMTFLSQTAATQIKFHETLQRNVKNKLSNLLELHGCTVHQ